MVKRVSKPKIGENKMTADFRKEFEEELLEEMEKVKQRIVRGDVEVDWKGIIYRDGGKE